MATSSFDKNIVITEPEAINRLVNSLLNDEPKEIDTKWLDQESEERGRKALRHFMSVRSKNL
ncbi:MAG TPA: hypothetical protein VM577_20915 [Anaerovoracaceae bacterium]|nr:hypothetical protein [Anaerovoracaceae bacterium]